MGDLVGRPIVLRLAADDWKVDRFLILSNETLCFIRTFSF